MKLTREGLASLITGREYRNELSKQEQAAAKEAGLIVVYGSSDDLVELDGAVYDEVSAYEGADFSISQKLIVMSDDDDIDAAGLIEKGWTPPRELVAISAKWCPEGFEGSWLITTEAPHSTFDINAHGELFCRGIVIDVNEIRALAQSTNQGELT